MRSDQQFYKGWRPVAWIVLGTLWLVGLGGLWYATTRYQFRRPPVAESSIATSWPATSRLELAARRDTLVYLIHPRCPCTRASTRQLQRLLDGNLLRREQQPRVLVLASVPSGAEASASPRHEAQRETDSSWTDTDLLRRCRQLPRSTVVLDVGGEESQRFGGRISGTVLLFDSAGNRLFAGGITAARGLEGDNPAAARLHDLLCRQATPSPSLLTGHSVSSPRPSLSAETFPALGCQLCLPSGAAPSDDSQAATAAQTPRKTPLPRAL
ncbi:hypothetical protein [Roseimaritima sediminicola]|uniref:hypothetical protein n=1 Tax=Roseimaritima sediminicola TaxID=2662066 RepID=UPI0012985018|nr:hypothetical protein [Roseimaritima sediminicola]